MKATLIAFLLLAAAVFAQDNVSSMRIPGDWLDKYGLSVSDPKIEQRDSDGDGFTNKEEWQANTNPIQKDSHPPYHTKLFLKQWIKTPFRLKFQSYDGDPKNPDKLTFQINTLDLRQPPEFHKIGDTVKGTKFKIISFKFKEQSLPNTCTEDLSELTVQNTEAGDNLVLTLDKIVDYPTSSARFAYYLIGDGISDGVKPFEFIVVKSQEFVLRPDIVSRYKLLDVNATEARIKTPDGKEYAVPIRPK